jgi:hypothetical protein
MGVLIEEEVDMPHLMWAMDPASGPPGGAGVTVERRQT